MPDLPVVVREVILTVGIVAAVLLFASMLAGSNQNVTLAKNRKRLRIVAFALAVIFLIGVIADIIS